MGENRQFNSTYTYNESYESSWYVATHPWETSQEWKPAMKPSGSPTADGRHCASILARASGLQHVDMHVSSVSIYALNLTFNQPKGHIRYSQIIIFETPFFRSMLYLGYVCKVNPSWAADFKTVAMDVFFSRSKQRWGIIHFETRPHASCW